MNKLAIALSAALSLGAVASANAAEATIKFTGDITAMTCKISAGGSGGTDVTLTPTSISTITNGSESMRETAFDLKLGDAGGACPGATATVEFEKTNVNAEGRLANTASGGSKNVQLALVYKDAVVNLDTGTMEADAEADNTYVYNLKARYEAISSSEEVTAGGFASALGINVGYR